DLLPPPDAVETGESISREARPPGSPRSRGQQAITAVMLFGPFLGVIAAAVSLFGHGFDVLDLVLALAFYGLTGYGVTAGYHRLFSHRSFKAARWLKVTLAVAG